MGTWEGWWSGTSAWICQRQTVAFWHRMVGPVVERREADFGCFTFSQAFGAVSEGIPEAKLGKCRLDDGMCGEPWKFGACDVLSLIHPGPPVTAQAGMGTQGRWWGQGEAASKGIWSEKAASQGGSCCPAGCPGRSGNLCSQEILKAHLDKALSSLAEGDPAPAEVQVSPQTCSVLLTHREGWTLLVLVLCMEWPNLTIPWDVFPAALHGRSTSAGVGGSLTSQTMFDLSLTPLDDLSSSAESHSMDPNLEGVLKASFIALNGCFFLSNWVLTRPVAAQAISFSVGTSLPGFGHELCAGLEYSKELGGLGASLSPTKMENTRILIQVSQNQNISVKIVLKICHFCTTDGTGLFGVTSGWLGDSHSSDRGHFSSPDLTEKVPSYSWILKAMSKALFQSR